MNLHQNNNKGMTMIEILIVLTIISMFFASFFYIWNTMDIFRKSRDSKRINDLQVIDAALKTILTTESNINLGQENVIYISLQDSSSTCGSYNLTSVYAPFSYHCSATPTDVSGNGWLPIDFTLGKILTIAVLPTDPLNNKDYFYAYQVKQGRYKLTARFESKTNISKMANDGGFEPTLYEVGSNLFIPSPHSGLVGYWNFDEGNGTTAYDKSGYGNNGTIYPTTTDLHSTSSCKIGSCVNLNGSNNYIKAPSSSIFDIGENNDLTLTAWIKTTASSGIIIERFNLNPATNYYPYYRLMVGSDAGNNKAGFAIRGGSGGESIVSSSNDVNDNNWHFIVGVRNVNQDKIYLYVDGVLVRQKTDSTVGTLANENVIFIGVHGVSAPSDTYFNGFIDEVKIYKRALSAEEIKALYDATK